MPSARFRSTSARQYSTQRVTRAPSPRRSAASSPTCCASSRTSRRGDRLIQRTRPMEPSIRPCFERARLQRLRKKCTQGPKVPQKHPSGAKALLILWALSARLKSCPFKTEASTRVFPQPGKSCPATKPIRVASCQNWLFSRIEGFGWVLLSKCIIWWS